MRTPLCAVLAAIVCLAFAASAAASTYCVPSGGGLGCTNAGGLGLQSALDAAVANAGADTVRIAAGTFTPAKCANAQFSAFGDTGNELTITGAGSAQTIITCPAHYDDGGTYARILTLSGSVTLSGVEIHLPAGNYDRGLNVDGAAVAQNIAVTADPGAAGSPIGVSMIGGTLRRAQILLGGAPVSEALSADSGSIIDQSSLVASNQGIDVSGGSGATVTRSTIQAPTGIVAGNDTTVRDTAIALGPSGSVGLQAQNYSAYPLVLDARNVSISGGDPSFSSGVDVEAHSTGATSATLTDSVIHGPLHPLVRRAVGTGAADITTAYDDYPVGSYAGTGPGTTTENGPVLTTDPGFADAAAGDLHIGPGSPLIDAGTPGALSAGDPATDPDGHARILDGNGDCTARRDIGAYEFSPGVLAASATASAGAAQGGSVTFHATGCPVDPAATIAFSWTFDDGATAAGAEVSHAFATAGIHHATVALSDGTGRTGVATAAVSIATSTPVTTTTTSTSTSATMTSGQPPALLALQITPSRFAVRQPRRGARARLGAAISWIDSAAATTTIAFTTVAPGVMRGHSCVAPPRPSLRRARRCRRIVSRGSIVHHDRAGKNQLPFDGRIGRRLLAAGRYRMTLTATLNGRTSRSASAPFSITR